MFLLLTKTTETGTKVNWVLHLTQYGALDRSNYFVRRHLTVSPPFSITAGQNRPHIMQHNNVIRSTMVPLPSLLPPRRACICPKAQQQQAGCLFLSSGGCISREEHVRPSRSCHSVSPEWLQQWQIICYFLPQSFYPIIGQTLQAKNKTALCFFLFVNCFLFVC